MATRRAGVLCHPTSLPGPHAAGDLGPATLHFLDWAAEAGFSVWQFLPLTPTGVGGSPYSGRSAFAGNPGLLSPELLSERGWLTEAETRPGALAPAALLRQAWSRFASDQRRTGQRAFQVFVEHDAQRAWLEDWVLYAALAGRHDGRGWAEWDAELARREPPALERVARELSDELDYQRFIQFQFFEQWGELRWQAEQRGIDLWGDVPFYVAHDSADVWAHPERFQLDGAGRPRAVAGVPPDYFSEDGQLWGNPLYDWARHRKEGYRFWIDRLATGLRLAHRLRLDHFRAFIAFWQVDAAAETARDGHWEEGPGRDLFDALSRELGGLPFVAEDLGEITEEVTRLRDELALPGMGVLQFGIEDDESVHHPGQLDARRIVYTGTHDNDTTRGWFESLDLERQRQVREGLGGESDDVVWRMIETAYDSPAEAAVIPLQDLLGLGSDARMNTPGKPEGNWSWRADGAGLTLRLAARLRQLAERSGRRGVA